MLAHLRGDTEVWGDAQRSPGFGRRWGRHWQSALAWPPLAPPLLYGVLLGANLKESLPRICFREPQMTQGPTPPTSYGGPRKERKGLEAASALLS